MNRLRLRILLAILLTLLLSIFPLPQALSGFRPPLTFLLLLYIQCYLPAHFNLLAVFFLGLCMDVLLSTVIGEHAFALLLTSWIVNSKSRRFQFFSIGQQMILAGVFCFIYQIIFLFMDAFSGFYYSWFMAIVSSILGMLFWPWLKLLADDGLLRRSTLQYR